MPPEKIGYAVHYEGMQTLVTQDDLQRIPGCRIPFLNRVDILLKGPEHLLLHYSYQFAIMLYSVQLTVEPILIYIIVDYSDYFCHNYLILNYHEVRLLSTASRI